MYLVMKYDILFLPHVIFHQKWNLPLMQFTESISDRPAHPSPIQVSDGRKHFGIAIGGTVHLI
jgi:hypothetical protein